MHCYHCGSPIPEDLKFCPQCGTSMEEQESPIEAEETAVPEAPQVEEIPAAELFEEEVEDVRPTMNDDQAFELDIPIDEDEPEEVAEEDDSTLDPTSPDFDPRKFAGLDHEEFRPLSASELLEEDEEEPVEEVEPKKEKKKGRGGIVLLVVALVLVLVAAAAGLLYWLTEPNKDLVVEDNFIEFMQLDADTAVTDFVIDSRETNRLKRADTVWCSVTLEDGSVHAEQEYVMNYRLTREGWKLRTVDERNTETWILTPMAGAPAEDVINALIGQQIEMGDAYRYALTEDDVQATQILNQDTDLAAGTDVVTAEVSVVGELVGWTAEVELTMAFEDGWQLAAFSHGEPELEFKPGMEFELTEEDYLDVLAANPMPMGESEDDVKTTVVTDGEEADEAMTGAQVVKMSKKQISELTVLETMFDMEENAQTVVVEFLLDKQVAKLQIEAALTYVFDDGWKIDTVEYYPVVKEIILDGEWKGVYPEVDGRVPGVTLTIAKNADGTDNNVFAFGPSEQNPYFFTGKYYVETVVDAETLEVALNATDWVLYYNPGGVTMVDLKGVLLLDEAVITDGQNFRIALQRSAAEEEEPINEDAVANTVVTNPTESRVIEKPAVTVPADEETAAPEQDAPTQEVAPAPEQNAPTEEVAPAPEQNAPTEEVAPAPEQDAPTEEAAPAPEQNTSSDRPTLPQDVLDRLGENDLPLV